MDCVAGKGEIIVGGGCAAEDEQGVATNVLVGVGVGGDRGGHRRCGRSWGC